MVAFTILALAVATNLFYHTNYVVMSHAFLFFLHALLIHAVKQFRTFKGLGGLLEDDLERAHQESWSLHRRLAGVNNQQNKAEFFGHWERVKNDPKVICEIFCNRDRAKILSAVSGGCRIYRGLPVCTFIDNNRVW